MMNINCVCIDMNKYQEEYDFWSDVKDFIRIILINGNVAVVSKEEAGVMIEFDQDNRSLDNPYPCWVECKKDGDAE